MMHPAATPPRSCPFCATPTPDQRCATCGRQVSAPRRPCGACKRMTPSAEPACMHCGARHTSDLRWKVPLIVALFLAAFVVSILLAQVR